MNEYIIGTILTWPCDCICINMVRNEVIYSSYCTAYSCNQNLRLLSVRDGQTHKNKTSKNCLIKYFN